MANIEQRRSTIVAGEHIQHVMGVSSVGDEIVPPTAAKQADLGAVSTAAQVTPLVSLATSAQLLAANTVRKGLFLINTDANAVLIKYGATASATSFTARIPGNFGQWEMPQPIYTGRIDAIWEADGSGSLYGTEL